ncbi:MAG: LysM peptidoglycan-binding domain-containing protein [Methylococcaceae bacterium]|nr:LysM peptidoglycan-binding domain-containing protein [Methylococcaceae bacterium]
MKWRILCGFLLLFTSVFVLADEVELNPDHPQRYTVVRGDTLWGIAERFLRDPWQWPAIWHDNPEIADPHWIYPGDELALSFVDGKPRLQVVQRPDQVRLSPMVRATPQAQAIPTIPMNVIQPFLTQPKVVDEDAMEKAPYVLAIADEHVVGGAGDRVYVRGMEEDNSLGYMIFRPGKPYRDAVSGDILGYEALYVADAQMQTGGETATLQLTKTAREVIIGDRVLPSEQEKVYMRYEPHIPAQSIEGHIISVVDGVSQIGQYAIVVIDRGSVDGIETGHVMEILQSGHIQRDIISRTVGESIVLPREKEGLLMIFRPYERVSFGLILKATRAIHLNDAVKTP